MTTTRLTIYCPLFTHCVICELPLSAILTVAVIAAQMRGSPTSDSVDSVDSVYFFHLKVISHCARLISGSRLTLPLHSPIVHLGEEHSQINATIDAHSKPTLVNG